MPVTTTLECDMCGKPNALAFHRPSQMTEALCSDCARNAALIDAAHNDLHTQLAATVQAWAGRWAGVGVGVPDLGYVLWTEATYWHPLGFLGSTDDAQQNAHTFVQALLDDVN
ncbi:hypothetical protein [Deinococcus fonticola]|uniref:hypothetical protein n=1 Tax=Deinococcus fonticola TaxID=2528713 RepID=UPI0010750187|nr:hypothetical protein [Deinococcus fonticola]